MSNFLHRNVVKSPVAEGHTDINVVGRSIERHQGSTRIPRSRVLKPPIG